MPAPASLRRRLLLAALLLLCLRGVAAPAWPALELARAPSGDDLLDPRLRLDRREAELRPLLPRIRRHERIGYISWVPSLYRVQYSVAPTIVDLNHTGHRLLLVELAGTQRAQIPAGWRELARSPRGQFVLLSRLRP